MINKKDIIKMAHDVLRRSRGQKPRALIDPHREWFIGIGLFITIAVIGGFITARNHMYYDALESTIVNSALPVRTYESEEANIAKTLYLNRRAVFNALVDDVPPPEPIEIETSTSTATSSDEVVDSESDADDAILEIDGELRENIATSTE